MILEKQSLNPGNRYLVMFNISGGKIGEDLGALFAQCKESNEKPAIPISELRYRSFYPSNRQYCFGGLVRYVADRESSSVDTGGHGEVPAYWVWDW